MTHSETNYPTRSCHVRYIVASVCALLERIAIYTVKLVECWERNDALKKGLRKKLYGELEKSL